MKICQRDLPIKPWIHPVAKGEWLIHDDAFWHPHLRYPLVSAK